MTAGTPALSEIESFGRYTPDQLLELAASLDQVSPHVLARPILKAAADRGLELRFPTAVSEEHGFGIRGRIDELNVALGKSEWLLQGAIPSEAVRRAGFERIVMLTGDHEDVARAVGSVLGVSQVLAERTPAEKLQAVQAAQRSVTR